MKPKIKPTNELQKEFARWGMEKVRERVEEMENPYPENKWLWEGFKERVLREIREMEGKDE